MKRHVVTLAIDHKPKGIPYSGTGELREDGDANYGFKYVKGNDDLLHQIPELQRDSALLDLVRAINAPETGLFSIGCVSGSVNDKHGHRHSGYVEFSLNSASAIADAQCYFPIFFHFDRFLHESEFAVAVEYRWELQPATFTAVDASGFTCSVFINTHYSQSLADAEVSWSQALAALASYLRKIPPKRTDFLYSQ